MPKTAIEPCSKEEINKIIESAMNDDFSYMLFVIAKKTGRRLGEYYDVQVKDINFEKKVMMTKVLKRRQKVFKEALLDDECIYLIKKFILSYKLRLDDYLFRKVKYRQIQNKIKRYAEISGIPHKVSFHNFRHFFITEMTSCLYFFY